MKSQAQAAAMHAAAGGHGTLGIPTVVGKKFVKASHGQSVKSLKHKVGKLPMHKAASPFSLKRKSGG